MQGSPVQPEFTRAFGITLAVVASIGLACPVMADYISPGIKDKGHQYTKEKPNSAYFGMGQGGRLAEASQLRIEADYCLQEHDFNTAEKKARKAVQLDPGYPEGHLYLARALTGKFYQTTGEIDEKLLHECIREWNLIKIHDADVSDQWEANGHLKKLTHVSKTMQKDRIAKLKRELKKKEMELAMSKKNKSVAIKPVHPSSPEHPDHPDHAAHVAAQQAKAHPSTASAAASVTATVSAPGVHVTHPSGEAEAPAATPAPESKLAEKKKRFVLF